MAKTWAGAVAQLMKYHNDEEVKIRNLNISEEEKNKMFEELGKYWDTEFEKINKLYPKETRFKDATDEEMEIMDEVFNKAEELLKRLENLEQKNKQKKK